MEKAKNNALATGSAGILPAPRDTGFQPVSVSEHGQDAHAAQTHGLEARATLGGAKRRLPAGSRRSQSLAHGFMSVALFMAVPCAAQDTENAGASAISGTAQIDVTGAAAAAVTGTTGAPAPQSEYPRAPKDTLETQIALARLNISTGSIDGVFGAQTSAALAAFQMFNGLDTTGLLDAATRATLRLDSAPLTTRVVSAEDIAAVQPLAPTWLGKSEQTTLGYASVLEMVAEQARANPALLRRLNPDVDWKNVKAGAVITVPDAACSAALLHEGEKAARVVIFLEERVLEVFSDDGRLLAHFPVSIARDVEKRPVGTLHVKVIAPNPNYTFDPDVFTESEEGRALGRKLIIPPGPNNPVGLVWIGLDAPGYGIHGTPEPEKVGRTESHGCFRLANWNAVELLDLVEVGTEVEVVP